MSENARMWMEIVFNVAYLAAIWALVVLMVLHRERVAPDNRQVARIGRWMFFLLALGDTGHVGFRVWAYASGSLETSIAVLGREVGLVGVGALATAITVTIFYVLALVMWHVRFGKPYGWFGGLLFAAAALRMLLMFPAWNQWNSVVPPQPWSTLRNLPLMLAGLGVAYLILRDARQAGDRTFLWIGGFIVASYLFYMPVIFFVQQAPTVGMLMIPKTLAYVGIALVVYHDLYFAERPENLSSLQPR